MNEQAPTAMQLMAQELVREMRPLLADLAAESRLNEALTKHQVARELKVAPKRVQALINSRTIRTLDGLGQMVSRRELERFTAGRKK